MPAVADPVEVLATDHLAAASIEVNANLVARSASGAARPLL